LQQAVVHLQCDLALALALALTTTVLTPSIWVTVRSRYLASIVPNRGALLVVQSPRFLVSLVWDDRGTLVDR
jgi:hypothetical protein